MMATSRLRFGSFTPASWTSAAHALAPSLVHMTSNRLGISIVEEAFLAFLLHRALEAGDA
jgi:hypothetical protein